MLVAATQVFWVTLMALIRTELDEQVEPAIREGGSLDKVRVVELALLGVGTLGSMLSIQVEIELVFFFLGGGS